MHPVGSHEARHCAAHSEVEARGSCAVCFKSLCDACATYELEIVSETRVSETRACCCERCGRMKEDDESALRSGLLAMIGVGYLATLAVGIVVFKARPFVGGLAAIVAIALGRLMQLLVKVPVATRRIASASSGATPPNPSSTSAAPSVPAVDATSPPL